jgi:hypothetical protein
MEKKLGKPAEPSPVILDNHQTTGDGYYESCVLDPDCNLIEIVGNENFKASEVGYPSR